MDLSRNENTETPESDDVLSTIVTSLDENEETIKTYSNVQDHYPLFEGPILNNLNCQDDETEETSSNASESIPFIRNSPILLDDITFQADDFEFHDFDTSESHVLKNYSRNRAEEDEDLTLAEFEMLSDCVYSKPSEKVEPELSPGEMAMKMKVLELKVRIMDLESKVLKLEKELNLFKSKDFEIYSKIDSLDYVSDQAKDFCKMLLSTRNVYSEKQKELACNLHFKSTSNYKFMREQLGFHIPSTRSIYNYFPVKQLQPGYNYQLRNKLRQLTKKMSKKMKRNKPF